MKKINAFILAAGKGTRLNNSKPSTIPKVLHEVCGQPMINYVLGLIKNIGIKNPIVIVGYKADMVKRKLGNENIIYVLQKEQLGTGHAIACAKKYLKNIDTALVMGGDDSAFYSPKTILDLIKRHNKSKTVITLLTIQHPNPHGLGRIIKNGRNRIKAIIEEKEATPDQRKIKEVNTGCYCFNASWLIKNLYRLKLHQTSDEYYITDLVKIAISGKEPVGALNITNHQEWVGINTPEQLCTANKLMNQLNK
jgi:bifunctional UDP-N-acetylglucosamine pyrophosphorylase/glucosamine-1-phosphate N-acetyltransferase